MVVKSACGVNGVVFVKGVSFIVDASDFESTIMPRTIAAAERMWTQPEKLDVKEAEIRLPYIRCVFNHRGVQASPTFEEGRSEPPGPGSCMVQ